jgi:hypothetical protein
MPQELEADANTAVSQPRCEIEKTPLAGDECERSGEVRYRGTLLCGPHAALLGLEERAEALLGSVFQMDEWMEANGSSKNGSSKNGSSAADEEFVGRIRHERDDARDALRLTRVQIRSARKALSIGH